MQTVETPGASSPLPGRGRRGLPWVLLVAALLAGSSAVALDLTVDSAADTPDAAPGDTLCDDGSGQCTLRAALDEAAANIGHERISFDILGFGVRTIRLAAPLPEISEHTGVTIDGTTQSGYSGTPVIEIDGSAVTGDCMVISAGHSNIYALNIHSCGGSGIVLRAVHLMAIERCFVGTDPSGMVAQGNGAHGLQMFQASDTLIGGDASGEGNLFSGNGADGIHIEGSDSFTIVMRGNVIGLNYAGDAGLANGGSGITIAAGYGNTIGGATALTRNFISGNRAAGVVLVDGAAGNVVEGNTIGPAKRGGARIGNADDGIWIDGGLDNRLLTNLIADNGGSGVRVTGGDDHAIRGNAIYGNAGLGIDLGADAVVTANDPLDADAGANGLQNFPLLTAVDSTCVGTTIAGRLDATPDAAHDLGFFANDGCSPTGHGQGRRYLGATTVTTNGSGTATFSVPLPAVVATGSVVTATATRMTGLVGATSEFSACVPARQTCFVCGDRSVDPGEECDQGGSDTASCDADCSAPRCGDGHFNLVAGEECDDGNTADGDGCSPVCATATCSPGSLVRIAGLRGVGVDPGRARFSWGGDPGALMYHLNSVASKSGLADPTRAPGSGRIECDVAPPVTVCEVTSPDALVYYQALSACGPAGIDEGPF